MSRNLHNLGYLLTAYIGLSRLEIGINGPMACVCDGVQPEGDALSIVAQRPFSSSLRQAFIVFGPGAKAVFCSAKGPTADPAIVASHALAVGIMRSDKMWCL